MSGVLFPSRAGRCIVNYRALLIHAGLIEAVPGTRPVRYRLTKRGRSTLIAEREQAYRTYRLLQSRL
ncbi:MAG: hypothetical protein JWN01_1216 [Patescibacteria group bacterium]|nr:hypothetical protein [Patescibacteria group bacterium]